MAMHTYSHHCDTAKVVIQEEKWMYVIGRTTFVQNATLRNILVYLASTGRWTNVGLISTHCLRRWWPNIKPMLVQGPIVCWDTVTGSWMEFAVQTRNIIYFLVHLTLLLAPDTYRFPVSLCITHHTLNEIHWIRTGKISLTLSSLNLHHCHLYPLQAANCCRNSRPVVDEDDLKWVKN